MNHSVPTPVPLGIRRALQCLALLLPALVPMTMRAAMRQRAMLSPPAGRHGAEPAAYLPTLGAPPLRFADGTPAPELVTRPAAAAPPLPGRTRTESSVALANAAAAQSTTVHGGSPLPRRTSAVEAPEGTPIADPEAPSSILPDEIRPQVRPEDFLPYFQLPSPVPPAGGVNPGDPLPPHTPTTARPPTSSATYRQTP